MDFKAGLTRVTRPACKRRWPRVGCGFVLPELMAVLALLTILALLAAPSFQHWLWRDRVDQAARNLLATFSYARSEAQRMGLKVSLCRFDGVGGCAKSASRCGEGASARTDNWACGWLVTVEVPAAVAPAGAPRIQVLREYPASAGLNIVSPATALSFTPPAGQVIGSFRNFEIALPAAPGARPDTQLSRCIRLAAGGRARISDGACGAAS